MTDNLKKGFRSSFVGVIGRPNVGKSTLINRLLGQELSVVSPKPQTTRNRIAAIVNYDNAQIIFYDTPGLHESTNTLNLSLVAAAKKAATDSDLILFLAPPTTLVKEEDMELLEFLRHSKKPVVLAINKSDLMSKTQIRSTIQSYTKTGIFEHVLAVSALTGEGLDSLIKTIIGLSPEGVRFFPEEDISDLPEKFFVSESIREQIILLTSQEVPYKSAVVVEKFFEGPTRVTIHADIHVERESQKRILIGKGGSMIKNIGTAARKKIEQFLDCPVHLELFVKVTPKWTTSSTQIRDFGY